MQVNRVNFPATLPHFLELLKTCDFYAFDEEMTGITIPGKEENMACTPEESYEIKRSVASRYSMIQVGICLFHQIGKSDTSSPVKYVARPFNFSIFPDEIPRGIGERDDVVLSSSAISFLRKNRMNFQTWVYEGISLCNEEQSVSLREWQENEKEAKLRPYTLPAELKLSEKETEWISNAVKLAKKMQDDYRTAQKEQTDYVKESFLPTQPSQLVQQTLEGMLKKEAPHIAFTGWKSGPCYLKILTEEEKKKQDQLSVLMDRRNYCDAIGFRLVFEALVSSSKPCVGHNCFADILFLMSSLDKALPKTLIEWKKRVHDLFPLIYDTKYLSTRSELCTGELLQSNYLGGLFKLYGLQSDEVHVELPLGFQAYDTITLMGQKNHLSAKNLDHEAGYDALMTGVVFLNLIHRAGFCLRTIPHRCANKVALFGSLFALDVVHCEDEFLPEGYSVIAVEHPKEINRQLLENCFKDAFNGVGGTFHTLAPNKTLGVLPPPLDIDTVGSTLCKRFPQLRRVPFRPNPNGGTVPISMVRRIIKRLFF